jgi:hypothetical protein
MALLEIYFSKKTEESGIPFSVLLYAVVVVVLAVAHE